MHRRAMVKIGIPTASWLTFIVLLSHARVITTEDICDAENTQPGTTCDAPTDDNRQYSCHPLTTTGYRCCLDIICMEGSYGVVCDDVDPTSTQCASCEGDTYNDKQDLSSSGAKCFEKNQCPLPETFVQYNGSSRNNRVCVCRLDLGYWDVNSDSNPGNEVNCSGPKPCPAGEDLQLDGGCKPCVKGMFKETNGTDRCTGWKYCDAGMQIAVQGTTTTDVECEPLDSSPSWTLWIVLIAVVCVLGLGVLLFAVVCCCMKNARQKSKKGATEETIEPQEMKPLGPSNDVIEVNESADEVDKPLKESN